MFLCYYVVWPCDLDLWPLELESVSCTVLLMSDPRTNFSYPMTIGYWVTSTEYLITFPLSKTVCLKKMFPFHLFIVRIKRICTFLHTYKLVLICLPSSNNNQLTSVATAVRYSNSVGIGYSNGRVSVHKWWEKSIRIDSPDRIYSNRFVLANRIISFRFDSVQLLTQYLPGARNSPKWSENETVKAARSLPATNI